MGPASRKACATRCSSRSSASTTPATRTKAAPAWASPSRATSRARTVATSCCRTAHSAASARPSACRCNVVRFLVVFAHPVDDSFQSALHRRVDAALNAAGHEVDDCNLYAEGFDPLLSAEERKSYHAIGKNTAHVEDH